MSSKKKSDFFAPYNFLNERSLGICSATQNNLICHRFRRAKNLYRRDLRAHFGCVNAIEFSHGNGDWIVSGGDDRRVLLWNVQEAIDTFGKPACMKGEHHSNIFCLAFDTNNKKVFSGGNDEQVIVHDATTGETVDVFLHEDAVYGLSADPVNDNVFASACDDGRVLIYDLRAPSDEEPFCLANYTSPMHAVMFNPVEPRLVATANSREGLGLWDVRKPRSCLIRYGGSLSQQSCMSVRINSTGDRVLGLRRRLPPVLYNLHSTQTMYQFDHSGYYNSCTMKSCCFAGDKDQYVISGSDDFNLYVWKIPEEGCSDWVGDAHLVLRGHRSIVNQVRFNPSNHLIVSSGVEKVVKMWSPFPLVDGSGDLGLCPDTDERSVYTHEQYINLVLRTGQFMTHDYTNESTEEDPRMMAFFDSLVQRELEGWSSEDSFSSHSPIHDNYVNSDTSLRSSPNVTAEEVQSIATDAILRFFAPTNAIANRSTGPVDSSTPNNTSSDRPAQNSATNIRDNNSHSELRTILDMDQNVPSVVSLISSNPSSSSTNSLTNVENGYTPDESQHEYSRKRSTNVQENESTVEAEASVSQAEATNHHGSEQQDENSRTESITNRDEPSTSHASDVAHEVGNRAATYKSISDLIQQKRKDYLSSIKKLEKRAIRRKMRYLARRKEKLKRIRLRLLPNIGDNKLSDSDSDDLEEDIDDFKEAQFSSDGSISSDSDSQTASNSKEEASSSTSFSSPGSSGQAVINEIVEKRQQLLNRVQKFKKLKRRVLNSDSSDSDSHQENVVPELSKENDSKNGQSKNEAPISLIPPPVYEDISNDSCPVDVANGQSENARLDFCNIVATGDVVHSRYNHNDDQVHKCDTTNGANAKYSSNCSSHETVQSESNINTNNDKLHIESDSNVSMNNDKGHIAHESNDILNNDKLHIEHESNTSIDNDKLQVELDKKCNGHNVHNSNSTLTCSQLKQTNDGELVTNGTVSEVNPSSVNRRDLHQESSQSKTVFKKLKSTHAGKRNYRRRDSSDNNND